MNLRLGGIAITDISTWRQDLWDAHWVVRRFSPFGLRLLLWKRDGLPTWRRWLRRLRGIA